VSAGAAAWLGERGGLAAGGFAGVADTHAAAVFVAALVTSRKMGVNDAIVSVLGGFTTNTVMKTVLALSTRSRRFARQVIPGLVLVLLTLWLAATYVMRWFM